MTATSFLRLFTLLFFTSTIQPAFAQKKVANTSKSTAAKTDNSPKAETKATVNTPVNPPAMEQQAEYFSSDILFLETGTPIFLETKYDLDSKFLVEGKMVCLYVKYPVKVQGRLIIPAGREAWCRVNRLVRPQGNGRAGMLEIEPMHLKTNDGQLVMLSGNPVSTGGRDREILAQALSMGGSAVGQQMMNLYQQRQANRQMELEGIRAYQQQQQLDWNQQNQQMALQQQAMQNQDIQNRQIQMMQQQQLMQQARMNPDQAIVVMPVAQQEVIPYMNQSVPYQNYSQAPQQGSSGQSILGAAASPALMGVATALNIISPFISIMIKGKRAKLPKGYTLKTCVGYGLVIDESNKR
jgi:hypothetical protein